MELIAIAWLQGDNVDSFFIIVSILGWLLSECKKNKQLWPRISKELLSLTLKKDDS